MMIPSKDGKDSAYEGRNGLEGVYCHQIRHLPCVDIMTKVLFAISTLTWRVINFLPSKKRYK